MTAKYILYTAKRSGAASVEVMLRALGLEFELKDATPWSEPPGPFFDELKTVKVNPFVCDVYLANLSRWWKMREYLKDSHPTFAAMMQRVDRLPVVAPVWKRHWP